MLQVYVVNHDEISGKPFDIDRTDLPYHQDIDEYNLRLRITVYCEEECVDESGCDTHTIYPSYAPTPTHTHPLNVHFVLMEFPAGAVDIEPTPAWVQIVSYTELQHTIGRLSYECGENMIRLMNRVTNTDATQLFSNRYDDTLLPKCLYCVGKSGIDHRTVLL